MVCWKKKLGRGYKIGAKDFGLKTKGKGCEAYSGWGKTVLFCVYCTHKPVPFN